MVGPTEFEKKLKKFTKAELIHILAQVVGPDTVIPVTNEVFTFQKEAGKLHCWDCRIIAKKWAMLGLDWK